MVTSQQRYEEVTLAEQHSPAFVIEREDAPIGETGSAYRRCSDCGVEAVTSIPWEAVEHRPGCPQ